MGAKQLRLLKTMGAKQLLSLAMGAKQHRPCHGRKAAPAFIDHGRKAARSCHGRKAAPAFIDNGRKAAPVFDHGRKAARSCHGRKADRQLCHSRKADRHCVMVAKQTDTYGYGRKADQPAMVAKQTGVCTPYHGR